MTINKLIAQGAEQLKNAGVTEWKNDATLLWEEVFDKDINYRLLHGEDQTDTLTDLSPEDFQKRCDEYFGMISERTKRIPLQHILGYTDFMGMRFLVNSDVLIPRQDTEILVEEALRTIHDGMNILDLCTGSGCILISLLKYTNDCKGLGADISTKALEVAKKNRDALLDNKENITCEFVESDMFSAIPIDRKFDIIVSNPPYICTKVIDSLEPEVKDHDPMIALDGGTDGLDFYRIIVDEAFARLIPGGKIFLEIGYDQGKEVSKLLKDKGYTDIKVIKDYAGLDRVVCAGRRICLTN